MYRNAATNHVTERSNVSRQEIVNDKESRLVTPDVLDWNRKMKTNIKKQIRDHQIAFYALASVTNVINLGEHQTIVFDNVVKNLGGSYHGSTGIFVGPVHGIYFFTVTALFPGQKSQIIEIVMDGVPINHFWADDFRTGTESKTEAHVFVQEVPQGSNIWVRTVGAGYIRDTMTTKKIKLNLNIFLASHKVHFLAFVECIGSCSIVTFFKNIFDLVNL
ncbi:hypothetical protein CHS0354_034895 [Potamilus streckersoni]|uniref:C1q domain-containing protein n=1 Tax=Potamilus streckersoni TaxID=2493646 RepID=A0AAE0S7U8_9BIVA|nr:hypothetical protein CHS0354_034895 [Potamilus streckersoni]